MEPIIKKVRFKPYNYLVSFNDTTYHVKQLGVTSRNLVTVNSKYIWNIKSGKQVGLQYKTRSSHQINVTELQQFDHPVIVFKETPYKVLKYINESDVIDISNENTVHGIQFASSLEQFLHNISQK